MSNFPIILLWLSAGDRLGFILGGIAVVESMVWSCG